MTFDSAYDPMRALSGAWGLLKKAPATVLIGGILLALLDGGGGGGGQVRTGGGSRSEEEIALTVALVAVLVVVGIVLWLFACLVRVGFASALEHTLKMGGDEPGRIFQSEGRWLNMVFGTFLKGLATVGAALPLLLFVGGAVGISAAAESGPLGIVMVIAAVVIWLPLFVYVALGISLVTEGIAVERLDPGEAFRRSWTLVRGNRLRLLVYYIVTSIFVILGVLACCIGVLFTGALAQTAHYEAYLRLVRSSEEQAAWAPLE